MADETKVAEATEKQAEEVQPEKAESVDDNNVKALQRELQRVRGRLATQEQTAAQLSGMQAAIDALVHTLSGQELDDASKQTLGAVQQLRQSEAQNANQRTAITEQIRNIAASIGVQSWDDPRVADVVDAFEEGDVMEALSLVKQVRRQAKSQKAEVSVAKKDSAENQIKAEVERQLKEMGVREVDKNKAGGAPPTPATVQEQLAKNIHQMTPTQMAQYKKELVEAYKRG